MTTHTPTLDNVSITHVSGTVYIFTRRVGTASAATVVAYSDIVHNRDVDVLTRWLSEGRPGAARGVEVEARKRVKAEGWTVTVDVADLNAARAYSGESGLDWS